MKNLKFYNRYLGILKNLVYLKTRCLSMQKPHSTRLLSESEQNDLFEAIETENDKKAKELIGIMDDINDVIRNRFGNSETPLNLCCDKGRVELVKYLIELGVDVNKVDKHRSSPLMNSVQNGKIVQMLIKAGADINATNPYGSSALSLAISYNYLKVFELILTSGVDLEKCGGLALLCASGNGKIKIVKRLVELGVDVNYIGLSYGDTSLHHACQYGNLEIVEFLMNNGCNKAIKNNDGKTAIELTTNKEIKEFINNYNSSEFVLK